MLPFATNLESLPGRTVSCDYHMGQAADGTWKVTAESAISKVG